MNKGNSDLTLKFKELGCPKMYFYRSVIVKFRCGV